MKPLVALGILIGLVSCAPPPLVIKHYQPQEDLLCQAYRTDSLQLLEQFFTNWQRNRVPLPHEDRAKLSEIHQIVYRLFEDYCDEDLNKDSSGYSRYPFCIIQNQIQYSVVDTAVFARSYSSHDYSDTIKDFRPLPESLRSKVVYVTPRYELILQSFIKGNCPGSAKNAYERLWRGWPTAGFLEQMVRLRASLLGFHIHSLPWLSVRLNSTLSQAVVDSYRGNTWSTDLYRIANGRWVHTESLGFSIE
jgi:hypothetical protein